MLVLGENNPFRRLEIIFTVMTTNANYLFVEITILMAINIIVEFQSRGDKRGCDGQ